MVSPIPIRRSCRLGCFVVASMFPPLIAMAAPTSIRIDAGQRFQTMEGFGASLTDASASLLNNRLTATQRTSLMNALFNADSGIGMSFLRQPMGASDFAVANYTFDDRPAGQTDYPLTHFSIAPESSTIIPLLQQAKAINPNLRLMGTPWSPPAWMKTGGQINGGHLLNSDAVYNTYGNYFVKYVQAYQSAGLNIDYVSMQNEPWYEAPYASMGMDPAEAARLIKIVGPKFAAAGIGTKILAWDHNWDNAKLYLPPLLADAQASQYVDGIAFHGYGGDVSAQNEIHNQFPGKGIFFTELTAVQGTSFAGDLMWDMRNLIVGGTRNWAKTIVRWNLALDQTGGPHIDGGGSVCRGMVTINSVTGQISLNEEYYSTGHLSRFVKVGAERIASDSDKSVAFINPDGSTAVIAYNDATSTQPFIVRWKGKQLAYSLPGQSAATFKWNDSGAVQVWLTTGDKTRLLARQTDVAFGVTQWKTNAIGDWFAPGNWTIAAPNGVDDEAILGAINTAPRTVYADQPLTLGRLRFDSAITYALAGASTLTLASSSDAARIEVARGTHIINLPMTIMSDTTVAVENGAILRIADPVTVRAGVTLSQIGGGSVVYQSIVTLQGGANLVFGGDGVIANLSLGGSSMARLVGPARNVLQVDQFSCSPDSSLDLGSSVFAVDNVTQAMMSDWIRDGQVRSRAVGLAGDQATIILLDDLTSLPQELRESVPGAELIALAAIRGDVDLDGTVTERDLRIISLHQGLLVAAENGWLAGDVTGDGLVDSDDLNAAFENLGLGLLPEPASMLIMCSVTFIGTWRSPMQRRSGGRSV